MIKKINKIIIGTHNRGKFREISHLISDKIKKYSPSELKIKSPKETGKTFEANAKLKAKYFFDKSKIISISDDSGLEIECLKNKPGIHSARWAKRNGGFSKAMDKLIKILNNKKDTKNRRARFICSLSIQLNEYKNLTVTGILKGKISEQKIGNNGFGYDPIFIPLNFKKTLAQSSSSFKNSISHRKKALIKLLKHSLFKKLPPNNVL